MNFDAEKRPHHNVRPQLGNIHSQQSDKCASLQDNRSSAAAQRKQVEAMSAGTPIQQKPNNTGLPDQLKSGIENLSGHSMDDVKVHYNSDKPAQLNAHAYAQGTDIHVASGQEKHLPHEAWHVVQQKQGRVQPTMQMKGKVNINDNKGLEKEADVMGNRAMRGVPSFYNRGGVQSGFHSIKSPMAGVLQREWIESTDEPNATHMWDKLMDGVTWYADGTGDMWFRIVNVEGIREGNRDDYLELQGRQHKRSWVAWNKQSIRPSPEFTADLNGDYGLGFKDDKGDKDWDKWDHYTRFAIGSAMEADREADVHKNPGYDASALPAGAQDYIARFRIITRQEYNTKLWEMAEILAKIGPYTCIVSEAGKSNFWVTARVLKKVQMLGGRAPKRIISVPTQEKGEKELTMGPLNIELRDAGTIVFLDDGSYSGSQLAKLINKVMDRADNPAVVGLVAESEKARDAIGATRANPRKLGTPYPIEEHPAHGDLDRAQEQLGFSLHRDPVKAKQQDGDHLLGLYYKVPDHASVRYDMLTRTKTKGMPTPITGYQEGRGVPLVGRHGIKTVGASEPYKSGLGTEARGLGLEEATHPELMGGGGKAHSIPKIGGMGGVGRGRPFGPMADPEISVPKSGSIRPGPSSRGKMSIRSSGPVSVTAVSATITVSSIEEAAKMKLKKGQKLKITNIEDGFYELAEDYDPTSAEHPDLNTILTKIDKK